MSNNRGQRASEAGTPGAKCRLRARLAGLACVLCVLSALAPAAVMAHPGHPQVQAPTAPSSPESGNEDNSSALVIVGAIAGLLAVGGLLAWLKIRDSRLREAERAGDATEPDVPAPAQEVLERTGMAGWSRRRRIQVAVAGSAAVLSSLGLLLLFGPGGGEPNAPPNLDSMERVDGTLVVVEDRRLVLEPFQPVDGRSRIEFEIREEDARYFDIAHLRSHSSVALPTRLYYERPGERYFARYKEDAPANSSRTQ